MCVDTEEVYARRPVVIPEITFPELLVALRKLDGVVADIPWIKVNMMIMMGEIRSDDQSALIELQADATALKLEVI
ncbi:hypothetical protein ONZ45_g4532 [Pleurotus djamor]|nr:hypothetical protein ONZ45_g4532 [Pleurotus djamor]